MASEKFGPHLPTIIEAKHIENLYELWGIDYAVEIEAPEDGETLETVRPGYCGAYTSHFQDGGLSFPLPRFLLEALAELGMDFAQMAPNLWRYFLASRIRAREEGLKSGLQELKQLFSIKRNNDFPRKMILAPRPDRSIIDELFGPAPMTPELRGLISTLRRGSPRWLSFTVDQIRAAYALPPGENCATPVGPAVPVRPEKGRRSERAREKEALPDRSDESSKVGSLERAQKARHGPTLRSRSQAQSLGLLATLVSIAVPVGGARRAPDASAGSAGDRALDDNVASSTHRRRLQALEEINSIREKGCELPSLDDMRERDAYVRMAVANAKAMEASNE
ncbi:uncharacterized protein LOC106383880 [Brassica napus]|uniref:uncharacterized protein LOC106329842 n=1 Tax=Brassica oleracea var. oleracea TaxID=109376 RepID=UPI0006A72290|nr:PREDICTED: uncharacterized protein LOC106329842 [Brassica oleracea var. oleracea]XP_048605331.1 uncharacterized protein LOC106383880 [Brassica napus]